MISIRKAGDRGHANYGWLDTYHTFSFGSYSDPKYINFRALRVMNEDIVAPNKGFPTHGHLNMEIITYVLEGSLRHKDSTGTGSTLQSGWLQRMSAGSGVTHSEYNASSDAPLHLYQIWLLPERDGIEPSYEDREFSPENRHGRWQIVASRDRREGSMLVHQDVNVCLGIVGDGAQLEYVLPEGRHAWVQVIRGKINLNGETLDESDGAAVSSERALYVEGIGEAEVMLFDLA